MVAREKIKKCCDLAIQNVLKEGITDVDLFSRPFELEYLKNDKVQNEIKNKIIAAIEKNDFKELGVHKIGHILVPKKDLCDFRKCALIDVEDELIYLTLVLMVARSIEQERINVSKNRVFSYRYKSNNGYLFDLKYHFTSFRNEVSRKSKIATNRILVECDISNFYDRLNIHRIESALLSFEKADNDIVALINEILLYWANRDSYGLPVGSNASRILAEASLVNVDRFLLSHAVDFCRFVDDYRIFAKDAETAHKHLALLTHCLSREGLFVNSAKTKMKDISTITKNTDNEVESNKQVVNKASANTDENANDERENLPKIIRGYNGLIPTKFRELNKNEIETLQRENISKYFNELKASALVEPDEVKQAIKIIVAQKNYSFIVQVPLLLRKFPQFIPYFVDFIRKYDEEVPKDIIDEVIKEFADLFSQKDDAPEYILVYLVRLFRVGQDGKNVLLDTFRNLKRTSGSYIGRALLESFNGTLSRIEALEIRESFVRSDNWEKRQILRLVQNTLPDAEKRAFFKDVSIHNADLFVQFIISNDKDLLKITQFK